jgi:hypothetical protein
VRQRNGISSHYGCKGGIFSKSNTYAVVARAVIFKSQVETSRLRANWFPSFLPNITDSSAASRLGFEAIDNIRVISNDEMTGPNVDLSFPTSNLRSASVVELMPATIVSVCLKIESSSRVKHSAK